jgi:hypothetical protein
MGPCFIQHRPGMLKLARYALARHVLRCASM